ncbi:hypothetical protein CYLTODRAFT_441883 [Cylindrobasidium torrendii FP15055 ss-10]|uniref:RING-type domain-containing protein n=1 Tax=Cylindrobasidium torrendii FP15055 ss-10 TaxID=1314674 RepID=A0A0D7BLR2_9AGAR|nr:hypothetical protein CYLTODRAFT_441883 [Cylindrobasidium torrendii FP15055 ss-10]
MSCMEPRFECAVCYCDYAIDNVRSLPCGHVYCSTCVENLYSRPFASTIVPCPTCRVPAEQGSAHAIYLTHYRSPLELNLKGIVDAILEYLKPKDDGVPDTLIVAVNDLREQLNPTFSEYQNLLKANSDLLVKEQAHSSEMAQVQRQLDAAKRQREASHLRQQQILEGKDRTIERALDQNEELVQTLNDTNTALQSLQATVTRIRSQRADLQSQLSAVQNEYKESLAKASKHEQAIVTLKKDNQRLRDKDRCDCQTKSKSKANPDEVHSVHGTPQHVRRSMAFATENMPDDTSVTLDATPLAKGKSKKRKIDVERALPAPSVDHSSLFMDAMPPPLPKTKPVPCRPSSVAKSGPPSFFRTASGSNVTLATGPRSGIRVPKRL